MSGSRLRRFAAATALGLAAAAAVGALAMLDTESIPSWCVPVLAVAAILAYELADLARSVPAEAAIEGPAVAAVLFGRLALPALLAAAAATLALLAGALPARHGLATGLLGIAAAALVFLLIDVTARRAREQD
jgi:hypothetical protein